MAALAVSVGGMSLMAFAVFLFAGSPGLIEFNLSVWGVVITNASLSLLFFVQHSGMIRRPFKRWMARFVPEHYLGVVYSITSGLALLSVVLIWQESQQVIATATGVWRWIARTVFFLAVGGVIWGAISLRGFDTLGLRPIRHRSRVETPSAPTLVVRGPYRWSRHPLYFFVLLMMWSHPDLTLDRALFNVLWTVWIVVGTVLEERDLVAEFGDRYIEYQRNVPMLIPLLKRA
jgi:protein-S-isoprenylcysteine O-methyltransferase Ste14